VDGFDDLFSPLAGAMKDRETVWISLRRASQSARTIAISGEPLQNAAAMACSVAGEKCGSLAIA
jgi:hypothetical protein